MNFTETFNDFSSKLAPLDLALYAGLGLVLWVLFKDKLSPVQKIILDLFDSAKKQLPESISSVVPDVKSSVSKDKDIFFDLVVSWKQTRDLAVKSGCDKAVEVADQMFPYLSPTVCSEKPAGVENE